MDERGWNQEFRTMSNNIRIQKKLERDLGLRRNTGAHLRTNLREIVAVEHLLISEGWLKDPTMKKALFNNLDKDAILDEELTQFWDLCGQNRNSGVAAILRNKAVSFKNVKVTEDEIEDGGKDLKGLKCDIRKLLSSKPVGDNLRDYFEATFKEDILKSTNLSEVDESELVSILNSLVKENFSRRNKPKLTKKGAQFRSKNKIPREVRNTFRKKMRLSKILNTVKTEEKCSKALQGLRKVEDDIRTSDFKRKYDKEKEAISKMRKNLKYFFTYTKNLRKNSGQVGPLTDKDNKILQEPVA